MEEWHRQDRLLPFPLLPVTYSKRSEKGGMCPSCAPGWGERVAIKKEFENPIKRVISPQIFIFVVSPSREFALFSPPSRPHSYRSIPPVSFDFLMLTSSPEGALQAAQK